MNFTKVKLDNRNARLKKKVLRFLKEKGELVKEDDIVRKFKGTTSKPLIHLALRELTRDNKIVRESNWEKYDNSRHDRAVISYKLPSA